MQPNSHGGASLSILRDGSRRVACHSSLSFSATGPSALPLFLLSARSFSLSLSAPRGGCLLYPERRCADPTSTSASQRAAWRSPRRGGRPDGREKRACCATDVRAQPESAPPNPLRKASNGTAESALDSARREALGQDWKFRSRCEFSAIEGSSYHSALRVFIQRSAMSKPSL